MTSIAIVLKKDLPIGLVEYEKDILATRPEEREILAVGIVGEQKSVRNVIGDLPLLK